MQGGGGVGSDGSITILHASHITRIDAGAVAFQRDIAEIASALADSTAETPHSAPAALEGNYLFFTIAEYGVVLVPDGSLADLVNSPEHLDDSGPSPAVLSDGSRILSTPLGSLFRWDRTGLAVLGSFGYDIVPPAVERERKDPEQAPARRLDVRQRDRQGIGQGAPPGWSAVKAGGAC
jgi:hypothetical protein